MASLDHITIILTLFHIGSPFPFIAKYQFENLFINSHFNKDCGGLTGIFVRFLFIMIQF